MIQESSDLHRGVKRGEAHYGKLASGIDVCLNPGGVSIGVAKTARKELPPGRKDRRGWASIGHPPVRVGGHAATLPFSQVRIVWVWVVGDPHRDRPLRGPRLDPGVV